MKVIDLLFLTLSSICCADSNGSPLSACTDFNLDTEKSYCYVEKSDINCYTSKAINFSKNNFHSIPWVQVCLFTVPQSYISHQNKYTCHIAVETGPVSCNVDSLSTSLNYKLKNFTRNCTFGFFYLKNLDPSSIDDFYKNLFAENGQCAKFYNNMWRDNDYIFVAERYLSSFTIPFSSKNEWLAIKTNKYLPALSNAGIISLTLSLVGIFAFIIISVMTIRRFRQKELSNTVIKQLMHVMEFEENGIINPVTFEEEIPYAFKQSNNV